MTHLPRLIVIVGPTASGKTSAGIAIAQKMHGVVISADSRQVFAELNIGTAKPRAAWTQGTHDALVPDTIETIDHYLLNIRRPTENFSLSHWKSEAETALAHIQSQQQLPIIVGGTMLYIDSLVYNYRIPAVSPNPALRKTLESESAETLYKKLISQDPQASTFIEPHHKQRIIRALEVIAATEQPFSVTRQRGEPQFAVEWIGIFPGWDSLKENIAKRVDTMLGDGLTEEVRDLQMRYSPALPLLQTINYREIAQVLNKQLSLEDAREKMISASLRYARRQMAWWKNNKEITWFNSPQNLPLS